MNFIADENKTNVFGGIITVALGGLASKFGALAVPAGLLFCFMILDYITGISAAKRRGEKTESRKSINGITKKMHMAVLVLVGAGFDILIDNVGGQFGFERKMPFLLATVVCVWLVINEGISIIENADPEGHKVPWLLPFVKWLKKKVNDSVPRAEDKDE